MLFLRKRMNGCVEYTISIYPTTTLLSEFQLQINKMQFYLGDPPLYQSPKNLFSLRFDFHYGGFDRAQFVIVPKWGKLVVHFLGKSSEFANGYHNVIFDHKSNLSHHALYARFAWAVFRRVAEAKLNPKAFKFPNTQNLAPVTSNEEGGRMHKRKREDKDRDEDKDKGKDDGEDEDKDEAGPSEHTNLAEDSSAASNWMLCHRGPTLGCLTFFSKWLQTIVGLRLRMMLMKLKQI
jgi:hypothetical protein